MSQSEDIKQITYLTREWRQTVERGELDAHINFLAKDAIVLYPGAGVMEPSELRQYEETVRQVFTRYEMVPTPETLDLQTPVISGDFAYNWGTVDRVQAGMDGTQSRRNIRSYLLIWNRESSGEWKIKIVMSNEDPLDATDE